MRPGAHVVLFVPSLPFLYGTMDAQVDHKRRYTKRVLSEAVQSSRHDARADRVFRFLGMILGSSYGRVLGRTASDGGGFVATTDSGCPSAASSTGWSVHRSARTS